MGAIVGFYLERGELEWFDGQGDNPQTAKALGLGSLGTVEAVVAHHVRARQAIRMAATSLYYRAVGNLAMHRNTGNARVGWKKSPPNELDYEVYLEDSFTSSQPGGKNGHKRSALAIEFGHKLHTFKGDADKRDRRVGGLFILTKAVSALARTPNRRWV